MAAMIAVRTVLAVKHLATSVAFYRDALGMALDFEAPGWAFLSSGAFRVMLGECPDAMPVSQLGDHSYIAYVTTDAIDELYRDCVARGVQLNHQIADKPWGMREFGIRTPDGHRIMFGQELA